MNTAEKLKTAALELNGAVKNFTFSEPVRYVYNPLDYAWSAHSIYLERFGSTTKKILFLGMNPGPWGMVQTGVPFGEIEAVKEFLGIDVPVGKPEPEHPKRPVTGFQCPRSEVSGKRLWGLFKERFGTAEHFSKDHYVANYCPLVFMEESGRNRTPDKLKAEERKLLFHACDRHLEQVFQILEPEWVIGVGHFAYKRINLLLDTANFPGIRPGVILHPSPASPAANRDWAGKVTSQMTELTAWT